jgi:hypothetical protein
VAKAKAHKLREAAADAKSRPAKETDSLDDDLRAIASKRWKKP